MTEREDRRRQVELSVVAGSALVLAVSYGLVARVDRARVPSAAPREEPGSSVLPPVPGLVPAHAARRRVVVVRRSRPS